MIQRIGVMEVLVIQIMQVSKYENKKINKIYDKGYDSVLNKYFILAMFVEFGETKYDRIFFSDKKDADNIKVGDLL